MRAPSEDFYSIAVSLSAYEASVLIFAAEGAGSTETEELTVVENLLENGNFDSGDLGWTSYVDVKAEADFIADEDMMQVRIMDAGDQPRHIQLIQSGVSLEADVEYTVELTLSSKIARSINVAVQHDGGSYTAYGS